MNSFTLPTKTLSPLPAKSQPVNTSGIHPTGRTVLVRLDPIPRMSEGGIEMPQEIIDRDNLAQIRGNLIVSGPSAFKDGEHLFLEPGSRVIFRRYAGEPVDGNDGLSYRIMNDKDIYATVDV